MVIRKRTLHLSKPRLDVFRHRWIIIDFRSSDGKAQSSDLSRKPDCRRYGCRGDWGGWGRVRWAPRPRQTVRMERRGGLWWRMGWVRRVRWDIDGGTARARHCPSLVDHWLMPCERGGWGDDSDDCREGRNSAASVTGWDFNQRVRCRCHHTSLPKIKNNFYSC